MTYPNPAGYYLPLPEAIESQLNKAGTIALYGLISQLCDDVEIDLSPVFLTQDARDFLNNLPESEGIALIRWLAERLAWLKSQEKSNNGQP
jgi:hypothetical protein